MGVRRCLLTTCLFSEVLLLDDAPQSSARVIALPAKQTAFWFCSNAVGGG